MTTPNPAQQRNTFITMCRSLVQLNDDMNIHVENPELLAAYKTAWDHTEEGLKSLLDGWNQPVFDNLLSDQILPVVQSGSIHAVNAVSIPEQRFDIQEIRDGFMLYVGPDYVEQVFKRIRLQGKLLSQVLSKAQTQPEWRPLLNTLVRKPMSTQNSSDFFYEISYADKPEHALNRFRDVLPQVLRILFEVSPSVPQLLLQMVTKHHIDKVKDHLSIIASTGGNIDFTEKRLDPLWEKFTRHQIMAAYTPLKELEISSHRGIISHEGV